MIGIEKIGNHDVIELEAKNELLSESEACFFQDKMQDWNKMLSISYKPLIFSTKEKEKSEIKKEKKYRKSIRNLQTRARVIQRPSLTEQKRERKGWKIKSKSSKMKKKEEGRLKLSKQRLDEKLFYKNLLDQYKLRNNKNQNLFKVSNSFLGGLKKRGGSYRGYYRREKERINTKKEKSEILKSNVEEKKLYTHFFDDVNLNSPTSFQNLKFDTNYLLMECEERRKQKLKNSSYYVNKKRALCTMNRHFNRRRKEVRGVRGGQSSSVSRLKSMGSSGNEMEMVFKINNKDLMTQISSPTKKKKKMLRISTCYLPSRTKQKEKVGGKKCLLDAKECLKTSSITKSKSMSTCKSINFSSGRII